MKDSTVLVIGKNNCGNLSLNHLQDVSNLTAFNKNNKGKVIDHIYSGNVYTIYQDNNNTYWAAGYNRCGSCGIGSYVTSITNCQSIQFFNSNQINIKKVCVNVNGYATFWISDQNTVYCNGDNTYGQLGLINITIINTPTLIKDIRNIIDVQSACRYSVALGFKDNSFALVILKHWSRSNNISHDIINVIVAFTQQSEVYSTNCHSDEPFFSWQIIEAFKHKDIIKIATGWGHTLFLESNGNLWCEGSNDEFQLGVSQTISKTKRPIKIKQFVDNNIKIKDMKCGAYHNLVIGYNNKVYSWGKNKYGQCGHGTRKSIKTPKLIESLKNYDIVEIQCGWCHSYCRTSGGEHFMFGSNGSNECIAYDKGRNVKLPYCINKPIQQHSNGTIIKSVSLGTENTKIILHSSTQ